MLVRDTIINKAEALLPELVEVRRHIHRHPELSYAEYETSAYITGRLERLGIEYRSGVAGTGVVGFIRGEAEGKGLTIALRADMDALPLAETTGTEYSSVNNGVMHACGHDAHVAMLLGAATILNSMRSIFAGTVILVFQPGEEKAPGGAKMMLETAIFDSFSPDIFIAQHLLPDMPLATVGFHPGPYMASCDEIYITVKGRGGHAAQPSQYTDQVYIASELVVALKDRVARAAGKEAPTVLGIGRITGMGATNVIPETVEIAGTFRTFDEKWRKAAADLIRETAKEIAALRGVEITVNIVEGYPVLVNDKQLTLRAMELSKTLLGSERVLELPVRMSSEDFSFFAERYPAFLYRVGITPEGEEMKKLHTSEFDIDESAMVTGTATMAWLTLSFIAGEKPLK